LVVNDYGTLSSDQEKRVLHKQLIKGGKAVNRLLKLEETDYDGYN